MIFGKVIIQFLKFSKPKKTFCSLFSAKIGPRVERERVSSDLEGQFSLKSVPISQPSPAFVEANVRGIYHSIIIFACKMFFVKMGRKNAIKTHFPMAIDRDPKKKREILNSQKYLDIFLCKTLIFLF